MTLSEFQEAARIYHRRMARVCMHVGVVGLVGLLWMPFYQRAKDRLEERFDLTTADWIAVLPVAMPITIAGALLIPLARRVNRKFGIPCSGCAKELASSRFIVIASRHCPYCGGRVIDETS